MCMIYGQEWTKMVKTVKNGQNCQNNQQQSTRSIWSISVKIKNKKICKTVKKGQKWKKKKIVKKKGQHGQ